MAVKQRSGATAPRVARCQSRDWNGSSGRFAEPPNSMRQDKLIGFLDPKWSIPPGTRLYVSDQGPHPAAARRRLKTRKPGSSCPVFRSPPSRLPLGLRRRLFHYQAEWGQIGHGFAGYHNILKHRWNACPRPGARALEGGSTRIVQSPSNPSDSEVKAPVQATLLY